jgi:two-component system phosphate regulon sensor histidine kinase PhoR
MFKMRSFQSKLMISYILILAISFGFVAFFLNRNLEEHSLKDISASLVNQANLIKHQISAENIKNENGQYLESLATTLSGMIQSRITITNAKGRVLADSERSLEEALQLPSHADRPEIQQALSGSTGQDTRYSQTLKNNMLYVAVPIMEAKDVIGVVRVALPLVRVRQMIMSIQKILFMNLLFALCLAFVLGSVLTAGIIKPINKIIHASGRFSKGDFTHRIYLDSKDEIGELATTLNIMAQSLEDKIKEIEIKNQHLVAIFESMVEGIIVVDKLNRIVSINHTVERIFNIRREDAEGEIVLEAIRNDDIAQIAGRVLSEGVVTSRELSVVWPIQKVFAINASPVFEKGAVAGCLLVIHDMTEIRKLETVRRDFVANVSHELKTPLTAIKGFVETLLEGALDDKENAMHFLLIIKDHTERLNTLINDLLDLSYLESREAGLEKKKFDLAQLTQKILSGFGAQLKKKGIEAQIDMPVSLIVNADRDKMEQVFTNLIDNAIKFNRQRGSIKIESQLFDGKIKIMVSDSGIGIPAKDLSRIFERFYRVDKTRSRELGGTGLGLSIVKHIIELHAGTVGVESTEGLGSSFWFILPA